MNNAIELSHVTKTYPTFTLQDLSLTLPTRPMMQPVGSVRDRSCRVKVG